MAKVRLFVNRDMTVIDTGMDTYANFRSYNRDVIVANVVQVVKKVFTYFDDTQTISYRIETDFRNPFRDVCSVFELTEENYNKVRWIEYSIPNILVVCGRLP